MVTGMHMDERSIDCLVLGHHDQDGRVSAKSVSMRAMTLCKNLSGYRELLLICNNSVSSTAKVIKACANKTHVDVGAKKDGIFMNNVTVYTLTNQTLISILIEPLFGILIAQSKKDQESIQSSTTPDPGHHMGK